MMNSEQARDRAEKIQWIESLAGSTGIGCREWPWGRNNAYYGMVRWQGKVQRVGHLVLELAGSPRPEGAFQLHSCDNPPCCAPWHLRWGTHDENVADKVERGRTAHGSGNGAAKLTDADVLAIRALAGQRTTRSIAAEYGMNETVIGCVIRGKTWRHLLPAPDAALLAPN